MIRTAVILVLLITVPALADQKALAVIKQAKILQSVADASADPVLMLAAARLRKTAPRAPEGWDDWPELLERATELASGREDLIALADDLRSERLRGAASGAVHVISSIGPNLGEETHALTVRPGEYAEVYVEGDAGISLDVLVHDAERNLLCSDMDRPEVAYCGWTPEQALAVTVTVRNTGTGGTYFMMTN